MINFPFQLRSDSLPHSLGASVTTLSPGGSRSASVLAVLGEKEDRHGGQPLAIALHLVKAPRLFLKKCFYHGESDF